MEKRAELLRNPRVLGAACAIAATALGLVYMAAAGAPTINLAVNALALSVGLVVFSALSHPGESPHQEGVVTVALGGLLLVTALFGVSVEGASRWISVGGLSIQPSLIFVPAMLVAFTQRRGLLSTLGVILAAVALALQPDRAMAGVLALALAVLSVHRQDRWVASALGVAVPAFAVALLRPDTLPAVPYVDQILYTAFEVHAAAGVAVVGGALLLIVPAISGLRLNPENRHVYSVFGAAWLSVVAAAALGNYPTPLVGYGASAVLGYVFSLSVLPKKVRPSAADARRLGDPARTRGERLSGLALLARRCFLTPSMGSSRVSWVSHSYPTVPGCTVHR